MNDLQMIELFFEANFEKIADDEYEDFVMQLMGEKMKTTKIHQQAEKKIVSYLKRQNRIITDIDKTIKKRDKIDFYLDGQSVKFKTTKNAQVNILFELLNNRNAGWFKDSKSSLFAYYIQEVELLYIIDVVKTKQFVKDYPERAKKTAKGMSGGGLCYMIKISDLKMYGMVQEILFVKEKNDDSEREA